MTRLRNLLSLLTLGAAIAGPLAQPVRSEEPARAVVELFTSQGCSSCPPADAKLGQLARQPGIIALSLPVDYWDYLGWKDTLAKPAHSKRQKGYASLRGDRGVYTPQMIVNGHAACVGSDLAKVEQTVSAGAAKPFSLPVAVEAAPGGGIVVSIGEGGEGNADVWLLAVSREREVMIQRGENKGRSVTYSNVVTAMAKLGGWSGAGARFVQENPPPADFYVALVQRSDGGNPGPIVGAARSGR